MLSMDTGHNSNPSQGDFKNNCMEEQIYSIFILFHVSMSHVPHQPSRSGLANGINN